MVPVPINMQSAMQGAFMIMSQHAESKQLVHAECVCVCVCVCGCVCVCVHACGVRLARRS